MDEASIKAQEANQPAHKPAEAGGPRPRPRGDDPGAPGGTGGLNGQDAARQLAIEKPQRSENPPAPGSSPPGPAGRLRRWLDDLPLTTETKLAVLLGLIALTGLAVFALTFGGSEPQPAVTEIQPFEPPSETPQPAAAPSERGSAAVSSAATAASQPPQVRKTASTEAVPATGASSDAVASTTPAASSQAPHAAGGGPLPMPALDRDRGPPAAASQSAAPQDAHIVADAATAAAPAGSNPGAPGPAQSSAAAPAAQRNSQLGTRNSELGAPAPVAVRHVIRAGDTLATLAARYYGDEAMWTVIAEANPSVNPRRLLVGRSLRIPTAETLRAQRIERFQHVRAAVTAPSPRDRAVRVGPGDSISRIAMLAYGDGNLWPVIYEANRDRLQDPDELRIGMTLRIPPRPGR